MKVDQNICIGPIVELGELLVSELATVTRLDGLFKAYINIRKHNFQAWCIPAERLLLS